jgi:predicted polyphosphate/ATP-dependent NAD kinase
MRSIGFIINPYAGMGGAVGLKGTDGCVDRARVLGATPVSPERAKRFLSSLPHYGVSFLTVAGIMGEDSLIREGFSDYKVVYTPTGDDTSSNDTELACLAMKEQSADLILFCGGDGTARDVYHAISQDIPILGVPAGVKIYSSVFATTPEAAATIVSTLVCGNFNTFADAEVLDVDEEQYRAGTLATRIYGVARIPYIPACCQCSKQVSFGDELHLQQDIARFICSIMRDDTLYLLGAGSTTRAIADQLHLPCTLLGIDAVCAGTLVASDLNEAGILDLLTRYDLVKIIVSPIGAQGFVLGRGNQQISSSVLKKTGINALIVVATPAKLQRTPYLYVDCGDDTLNQQFGDSILVICGDRMAQRKQLKH